MKTVNNIHVTDITRDDLVNLFSTALYGSPYLYGAYDRKFYGSIPENLRHGLSLEDKMADTVLNGGTITFTDSDAEGEVYSALGRLRDKSDEFSAAVYTVTMDDIIKGIEDCAGGGRGGFEHDSVGYMEEGDLDFTSADALLQNIIFGETVYG